MTGKKGFVHALCAILIAEAILVVLLPAPIPRAVRALAAAINLIATAVLWLMVRQRSRTR